MSFLLGIIDDVVKRGRLKVWERSFIFLSFFFNHQRLKLFSFFIVCVCVLISISYLYISLVEVSETLFTPFLSFPFNFLFLVFFLCFCEL